MSRKVKVPKNQRVGTRKMLDALIDWYEANRPGQTFTIEVRVAFCHAKKFCKVGEGNVLTYRGARIRAVRDSSHCNEFGLKSRAKRVKIATTPPVKLSILE